MVLQVLKVPKKNTLEIIQNNKLYDNKIYLTNKTNKQSSK